MHASRVFALFPARELIALETPPSQGSWICGVAAVRGREFPVVDLRGKLGIPRGSRGRDPLVVAVEVISVSGTPRVLGFVADRVSEVLTLRDRDFRNGSVRVSGRSRRVLDPDSILTEEELTMYFAWLTKSA
jgi:chemotaxis signal transduction protein